jgi:hypothetical protein
MPAGTRLGSAGLDNINLIYEEFSLQDRFIITFDKTKIKRMSVWVGKSPD